jgi:hypothetical protein
MLKPVKPIESASCGDLNGAKRKASLKLRETASDRLRLEVAISGESEMYSWVGEDRFGDQSLAELVGGGATSTGAFANLLGSIFGTNDANFSYHGAGSAGDKTLVEFGFVVPLERSHYSVGNKLRRAIVKYEGTFRVDPKTLDLKELTVHIDELPKELRACEDTTTLTYETALINGAEFLLPNSVRFRVTGMDGSELDNRTAFSGCREFHGESTLHFEETTDVTQDVAKNRHAALELASGLPFTLVLTQSIDPSKAAAGDIVKWKLTTAIRNKHRETLVGKDAIITARIIQLERLYGIVAPGVQSLRIGIRLESVEINGFRHPFDAQIDSVEKRRVKPATGSTRMTDIGVADRLIRREDLGSFEEMLNPPDANAGYLVFDDVTSDYVIRPGLEISGKTSAGASHP